VQLARAPPALPYTAAVALRFFAPEASGTGAVVVLPDDEAAHLMRVLRLGVGDAVCAFDGRGGEWQGEVAEVGKHGASIRLLRPIVPVREADVRVTLSVAVLKGDKMDDVVRDAVMMGVAAVQPIVTTRAEVSLAAIERRGRVARWQRIAIASAKQCGRAVVPTIHPATDFTRMLEQSAGDALRVILVEPRRPSGQRRTLRDVPRSSLVELIVGPEGGWTDEELDQAARAGAMLVTLGDQTLRADAAPLVAIAALRALWNDL
jgi:16S rRNA (uracil1498-N3)-methyltransferase